MTRRKMMSAMGARRFAGDRYQRLRHGARVLALDPLLADGAFPFDATGLSVVVAELDRCRVLDQVTEREADMASALFLLDFPYGAARLARRIANLPSSTAVPSDIKGGAVADVLATALGVVMTMPAVLPTPQREH